MNTNGLNFGEMRARVARVLGKGSKDPKTGVALPDTDAGTDQQIGDAVNAAAQEVINSRDWTFLYRPVTVTLGADSPQCIDGDASQYALPEYVIGPPTTAVTFTTTEPAWGGMVEDVDYATVLRYLSANVSSGCPYVCAAVPIDFETTELTLGTRDKWRLIVAPLPNLPYVLKTTFRVRHLPFEADQAVGLWPADHDNLIMAAAILKLVEEGKGGTHIDVATAQNRYNRLYAASVQFDDNCRARAIGDPRGFIYDGTPGINQIQFA